MRKPQNTAFTLAELMVVVTIIALLAAIILPFFQRAFSVHRDVHCKNNLEKIGQAYYTMVANDKIGGARFLDFVVGTWSETLGRYAGGSKDLFHCLEDTKEFKPGESAMEKLRTVFIEVYRGPANSPPHWYWSVPLDESYASEYIWRLSEEQFRQLEAAPGHGRGYNHPGYRPGANPNRFYFTFEDQGPHGGGDMDFWDQLLRIDIEPDKIVVTPISGAAGYNFSLTMEKTPGNKEVVIEDLKKANGIPFEIPGGFGQSSYGMNSLVADLLKGERKLLVVDYEKPIAAGSTFALRPDPWLENEKTFPTQVVKGQTIPLFFRHFAKANVLLADGTVDAKSFKEISIYRSEARETWWDPSRRPMERDNR